MIGWRDLTLIGKLVLGLAVVITVILLLALAARTWSGLTSWLPGSPERRLEQTEARADRAEADAAARSTEVQWLEKQRDEVAASTRVLTRTRTITERAVGLSQGADDATVEMDPGRADRLRDADRRLCELGTLACSGGPAPD